MQKTRTGLGSVQCANEYKRRRVYSSDAKLTGSCSGSCMVRGSAQFSSFLFHKYFCEIEFTSIRITRHVSRCVILPAWLEFRIVGRLRVEVYLCNRSRIDAACATRSEPTTVPCVARCEKSVVRFCEGKTWQVVCSFALRPRASWSLLERIILIVCRLLDYLVNVGRTKRGARGSWKCECAFARSFRTSDFRSSFFISSEISTSGNLCKWQISAFVKLRDRRLNYENRMNLFLASDCPVVANFSV